MSIGGNRETIMRGGYILSMKTIALSAAAVGAIIAMYVATTSAQTATGSTATPAAVQKTPWGEPDLQGIWMDETDTPLQRPAKYAGQEFFTEAQRAALDAQRAAIGGKDNRR